jgi:ribosomal protein S18 acetylase RimI-like enzyme
LEVRHARVADGEAIRNVHIRTWKHTYLDQLPHDYAADRLEKVRNRCWESVIQAPIVDGGVLVLVDNDEVVGFCEYGPTSDLDDNSHRVGHVFRLYVDPRRQSRGGGRMLLDEACAELMTAGRSEATLWTLDHPANRAIEFYESVGWKPDGARSKADVADLRYRRALDEQSRG